MFVYISLLALVVIAGIPLCGKKYKKWGKAVYCAAAALLFIFVSSVRFQVGHDYNSYASDYINMTFFDLEDIGMSRMEKGYTLPLFVLNEAFDGYFPLFLYTSIVIYAGIFFLIYKYSEKPWISVSAFLCFGIFFNSLCFLRQMIAAVIIAFAIRYIGEHSFFRFAVLVLCAATFHWSALLLLPFYFLLQIKQNWTCLGVVTALTVLGCIFSKSIMNIAIKYVFMYQSYDPSTNVEASTGLNPRYLIMFGIIYFICFLFRKGPIEKNPNNTIYLNCLMYAVVFEAFGTRHAILSRFTILFYLPMLFLLPDVVSEIYDYIRGRFEYPKLKRAVTIVAASLGIAFSAGMYLMLMFVNYNGVMPYDSIIYKSKNELYTYTPQESVSDDDAPDPEDAEDLEEIEKLQPADDGTLYDADDDDYSQDEPDTDEDYGTPDEDYDEPETDGDEPLTDEDELNDAILDALG